MSINHKMESILIFKPLPNVWYTKQGMPTNDRFEALAKLQHLRNTEQQKHSFIEKEKGQFTVFLQCEAGQ